MSLQTVHTNLYEAETNATQTSIDLDMEIWRSSLLWDIGLGQGFELQLEIPFLHFSGGFLDAFIQDYHQLFGFPNGGRETVENGRFAYTVSQNGAPIYTLSSSAFQMGDWTVGLKVPISLGPRYALALEPLVKLPVGDPAKGSGSGHLDLGLAFLFEERWAWFSMTQALAPMVIGGHDDLDPILKSHKIEWAQTFAFSLAKTLRLLITAEGSTALFKQSDNDTLDGIPLDLVIGFSGTAFPSKNGHFFWQVAFSEDLLGSGPSVDFSSYMRIGYLF